MARAVKSRGRSRTEEADEPRDEERSVRRRPGSARPSRNRDEDSNEPRGDGTISEGWDDFDKYAKETASGDFADDVEVAADDSAVLKILDEKPLTYKQHWIDAMPKGKKKSYVCMGDDCPLCDDIGDKPRAMACFHVVDFSDPDDPALKILRVGPQVAKQLQKYAQDKKTMPINRDDIYFELSHDVKNKKHEYTVLPIKARDLEEDYEIAVLTDEELASFEEGRFDRDQIIKASTRAELRDVVDEVMD